MVGAADEQRAGSDGSNGARDREQAEAADELAR
jgi:hypothetical protein